MMSEMVVVVLTIACAGALAFSVLRAVSRRATLSRTGTRSRISRPSATPEQLGSGAGGVGDRRPLSRTAPEPTLDAAGRVSRYRVRPGASQSGEHWDPYDEAQSRRERAISARRRPHRSRGEHARTGIGASGARLDYYATLGVRPDASIEQIEAAYRRYAAQIHPDRFFDDPVRRTQAEARLKQLNAIMATLRDPRKRTEYDTYR